MFTLESCQCLSDEDMFLKEEKLLIKRIEQLEKEKYEGK